MAITSYGGVGRKPVESQLIAVGKATRPFHGT